MQFFLERNILKNSRKMEKNTSVLHQTKHDISKPKSFLSLSNWIERYCFKSIWLSTAFNTLLPGSCDSDDWCLNIPPWNQAWLHLLLCMHDHKVPMMHYVTQSEEKLHCIMGAFSSQGYCYIRLNCEFSRVMAKVYKLFSYFCWKVLYNLKEILILY